VTSPDLLPFSANHRLHGIAFSPDSKLLAACSADEKSSGGQVYLWDLAAGKLLWQKEGNGCQVNAVVFAPDGKTLATGGYSGDFIKLWDMSTGAVTRTLTNFDGVNISSLAFSKDGSLLVSGEMAGLVRVWDIGTGKVKHKFDGFGGILMVAFARDGQTLVAGSARGEAGMVQVLNVQSGAVQQTCPMRLGSVRHLAFVGDGQTVTIACWDKTVTLWPASVSR
jgi:WD40 repeat protein